MLVENKTDTERYPGLILLCLVNSSSATVDSSQAPVYLFYGTHDVIADGYCLDHSSGTQDVFIMESRNYIHASHDTILW